MPKFVFHKLVRDKIVSSIQKSGIAHFHVLTNQQFLSELKLKLEEEVDELKSVEGKKDILQELSDIQTIIDAFLFSLTVTKKEFTAIRNKKDKQAGVFKKKQFIESVEVEANSKWTKYYRKHPQKYPEVKQ